MMASCHENLSPASELTNRLVLDGHKLPWHMERVRAWERGERFAPITVDMALTRRCQAACVFCYAVLQESDRKEITIPIMDRFLTDCAEMGVKGISLVSDGESTISPAFAYSVRRGAELGISMASGTNGYLVDQAMAEAVLPYLTYIRVNYNGGTLQTNARIMGVTPNFSRKVLENVKAMVAIKARDHLSVTIGLQQVLMPQYGQEIIPLARLALDIGVDYLVIKHCSDDEAGTLGVDYKGYLKWYDMLRQAEAMSTCRTKIITKWSKIQAGNHRDYSRCYGTPFILQISGSGLVAPCGMLFNERYAKFHIGNIVDESFKDILNGERYWEVMNYLASDKFDAQRMCGFLCLQDRVNLALDRHVKGLETLNGGIGQPPVHVNFL